MKDIAGSSPKSECVSVWNASFCSCVTGQNKAVHSECQENIFLLALFMITQPLDSRSAILSVSFALQSNKAQVLIDQEVEEMVCPLSNK